jgi:hypothetical protein
MFFTSLILFFKRLFGRFLPKKMANGIALLGGVVTSQIEPSVTTLKIREVFKHLLRDASKAGLGRRRSETPLEYAQRFIKEIPDADAPMHELTQLYVRVRYSDYDAGDSHIVHVNGLWRQIRELLKIRKSEQD